VKQSCQVSRILCESRDTYLMCLTLSDRMKSHAFLLRINTIFNAATATFYCSGVIFRSRNKPNSKFSVALPRTQLGSYNACSGAYNAPPDLLAGRERLTAPSPRTPQLSALWASIHILWAVSHAFSFLDLGKSDEGTVYTSGTSYKTPRQEVLYPPYH